MSAAIEWPDRLFATLKRAGVRQVGYVPDAGHSRLIERCRADADIRDVALTTEEEGVALCRRRLARRPARRAADAVERRRQLHQHVFAGAHLPLSAADVYYDARRVGGVQSVAGADGLDRRSGAQIVRGRGLSREQSPRKSKARPSARCRPCSATSALPPCCCRSN